MSIDWLTVGGQALNFVILVWLMKRFLYKPILAAIDARETKIATKIADADTQKADAKKSSEEFKKKNEDIDKQRADLLGKAKADAKAEHERLMGETRKEADELRSKRQEALQNEHKTLSKEISRLAQAEVFAIARKALADLAGVKLEEQIIDAFIRRLNTLSAEEKTKFTAAFKTVPVALHIASSFEFPSKQRHAIEDAIKANLAAEATFSYKTSPDIVAGIELSINGHKVAWSLADYLSSMQRSFKSVLKIPAHEESEQLALKSTPAPKPEVTQT